MFDFSTLQMGLNIVVVHKLSSISELQIFIYDDSYIGQSAPACSRAPAAIRGIYTSSYTKFWNSEIGLKVTIFLTGIKHLHIFFSVFFKDFLNKCTYKI